MDNYGLLNDEGTDIIYEFDNDDGQEKAVGGRRGRKFPVDFILANGFIKNTTPATPEFHVVGVVEFAADSYSRTFKVIPSADIKIILSAKAELKSDLLVSGIAPPRIIQRAIAKGASLNRKKVKHLTNPAQFSDLTADEEKIAESLEAMQEITEAIREAEDLIIEEIEGATVPELLAIDVESHQAWPT